MKENCRGQTLDQGLSGFLRFSKLQRSLLDFCQAVPFDLLGKCPERGHILQQVLKIAGKGCTRQIPEIRKPLLPSLNFFQSDDRLLLCAEFERLSSRAQTSPASGASLTPSDVSRHALAHLHLGDGLGLAAQLRKRVDGHGSRALSGADLGGQTPRGVIRPGGAAMGHPLVIT